MKIKTILLGTLMLATLLIAQPRLDRPQKAMGKSRNQEGMVKHGPRGERPNREKMEAMMVWKLTERLELTSEQAQNFFPKFKTHRDRMDEINQEIRESEVETRKILNNDKKISNRNFNKLFEKNMTLERSKIDEKVRFMNSLNGILDNSQKVKFVGFKNHFSREMKEQLKEHRNRLGKEQKKLNRYRKTLAKEKAEAERLKENIDKK